MSGSSNMYALQHAKQEVLTELKKAVGKGFSPAVDELSVPPDRAMGDLAFPCFALAKGLKRNPVEIAKELATKIGPKGFIKSVSSVGPYVNFSFDGATLGEVVLTQVIKDGASYGRSETGVGKRVMVEYANPNTHKDVHIGHLRNFFVGQVLVNVLEENGFEVIPVSYINDLGAHVAMCLWGIKHVHTGVLPPKEEDPVTFMGRMYAAATAEIDAKPGLREEVSSIHRDLEAGQGPYFALWKKTRLWSLRYMKSVFKELNLPIKQYYYESDLIGETKSIIEQLIKRGIVTHSNGAWIVDLEAEGFGVNLLVKTDGTLLYNAKDLALAAHKEEDYHAQRSLYVIDARQSLAMNQLFATWRRMGKEQELTHVSYNFVTLKDGAMASRKGNIIRYEFFRDAVIERTRQETAKRHSDWKPKRIDATARAVAFGAIRFSMLKQDLDKNIIFDFDEALSFDGFTGPYLLYTNARIYSIVKKAKRINPSYEASKLTLPVERRLIAALAAYPEAVFAAGTDLRLSGLAQFLFDLAKRFSEFYNEASVLQAPDKETASQRLALCEAVQITLENGLKLLGMTPVKEM